MFVVLKTRKHFIVWLDFFFLNRKNSHCLTTFTSLDTKRRVIQLQFYGTTTNSPVRCFFWGSDKCGAVLHYSFHLPLGSSSSCSETLSFVVNFFKSTLSLSSVSRCHHINFNAFSATPEVLDKYIFNNLSSMKWVWQHR